MKLVIEHYGKFLVEGIVVVALMALIFTGLTDQNGNKGIFAVTGAQMHINGVNYHSYTDFKNVYKTESEKEKPKITFTAGRLVAGTHALSNYIKATDDAGQDLVIKVESILAPDGSELLASYNQDTTEVALLQPGAYTVTISAVDTGNNTTRVTIQIPVNSL